MLANTAHADTMTNKDIQDKYEMQSPPLQWLLHLASWDRNKHIKHKQHLASQLLTAQPY